MSALREDLRDVRAVLPLLGLRRALVARAVALGSLTLGASVALAGVAAWLIVRASQAPPVMFLNVAAVGVRTFGIVRGLSRYLDRLASHDVALRGVVNLRTEVYERLARGRTESLAGLRRGDVAARTGADVDDVGDVVVRALVPAGVALVVSLGSVLAVALFHPASALVLLACLAVSALVVPLLAARGDAAAESERVAARSDVATASEELVSRAAELALSGGRTHANAALAAAHARTGEAERAAARPLAASAALAVAATGASVIGTLLVAVPALLRGDLAATELGVVVLLPLAAFEATAALPAAVTQLHRSAAAARRITALLADAGAPVGPAAAVAREATPGVDERSSSNPATHRDEAAVVGPDDHAGAVGPAHPVDTPGLHARDLVCAWPGRSPVLNGLDLDVAPGTSLAIVGPSGVGKTTLLLTLAGMLPPAAGRLSLDGATPHELRGAERTAHVALTTEDAHVFSTTVLENLRAARGDVTAQQAREALAQVGLQDWVASLPDGLDTAVTPETISGGERRRLLVARALVSRAPLLLLDEPGEHLPDDVADALVADLLGLTALGRSVVVVTHHTGALGRADAVLDLSPARAGIATTTGTTP
ncbi:thiol reductant ABC exporter subunit CydC [Litorihabitans aurantiacus]|uniref:Thiol reductant ABC exporter subunit CydC n=1 Tax=Litorihabitans aurantiacus TaxID=1930061 RepID=A0AA37UHK1_9MICO|nr:thiol reductant ABC exporter subunit CydC [Litorihabitans aurantiacus]GMA30858.1 thiol reductant ABC exporter subunit CydC [Litorihabitans aurantiacus]